MAACSGIPQLHTARGLTLSMHITSDALSRSNESHNYTKPEMQTAQIGVSMWSAAPCRIDHIGAKWTPHVVQHGGLMSVNVAVKSPSVRCRGGRDLRVYQVILRGFFKLYYYRWLFERCTTARFILHRETDASLNGSNSEKWLKERWSYRVRNNVQILTSESGCQCGSKVKRCFHSVSVVSVYNISLSLSLSARKEMRNQLPVTRSAWCVKCDAGSSTPHCKQVCFIL